MEKRALPVNPISVKTEKEHKSRRGQLKEYANAGTNAAIYGAGGAIAGGLIGAGPAGAAVGGGLGSVVGAYKGIKKQERSAKLEPEEKTSPGKFFGRALFGVGGAIAGAGLGSALGAAGSKAVGANLGQTISASRTGGLIGAAAGGFFGDRIIRNSDL